MASESRVIKSRHVLDNSIQNVGRDIIFRPVLSNVLMPAENKARDIAPIKQKAKVQTSVEPKVIYKPT